MPINQENFNSSLYDLLKTKGYRPEPIDSKGQVQPVPQDADVFKFEFTKNDEKYGTVYITVEEASKLIVYYSDEVMDAPDDNTSGTPYSDSWSTLLQHLKYWAQRRQLGFELRNKDHLVSDMAQREHMKKKEKLGEGYYPMGKKASYNDSIPQVKIILQHTRQIEEGEQRYRNIAKIFVENANGERFAVPTTRPGIAKVYARHVAEGGTPYDERGKHITSLVEEYSKMAGFVRAVRNNTFNESAQQLVQEGLNHYQSLRESLSRMIGHRGYHAYFEAWTPVLNEETTEETNLNELFVQETLDPRIESVLPILSKLQKKTSEVNEVKMLENWADELISETTGVKLDEVGLEESEQVNEESHDVYKDYRAMGYSHAEAMRAAQEYEDKHKGHQDYVTKIYINGKHWQKGDNHMLGEKGAQNAARRAVSIHNKYGKNVSLYMLDIVDGKTLAIADFDNGKWKYRDLSAGVTEELDTNQKRVGQLGPTEKVKKNSGARGKLVGANESYDSERHDFSEAVANAIIRRIVNQHVDLVSKYGPEKIMAAAEGIGSRNRDLSELGTSDVSIFTKQAIEDLEGGMYDHLSEAKESSHRTVHISKDEWKEFESWMESEGLGISEEDGIKHNDLGDVIELVYPPHDPRNINNATSYMYASEWDVRDRGMEEGVVGTLVGGAAGAYVTKSPSGTLAGAELGSKIEDQLRGVEEGQLDEKWGTETKVAPSEKGKYEGKSKAELLKHYNQLKKSGPHKKGSKEFGTMRELAFAIRAKSGWGKVKEEAEPIDENLKNLALGATLAAALAGGAAIENKMVFGSPLAKEIAKQAEAGDEQAKKDLHNLPVLIDRSGSLQTLLNRYGFKSTQEREPTNESVELIEMDKSQPSSDRGGESSGNPYAKGSKATPAKAKDVSKDAEKILDKAMDKANKKEVKEGQEDLDAILRIVRK